MKTLFRVVQQSEASTVQSQKAEGSQILKCTIVLQEFGGKFEDQFVGIILGDAANIRFRQGDLVAASLHFNTRDYKGSSYQDVIVKDIQKLNC